jgi:hypothetical protein
VVDAELGVRAAPIRVARQGPGRWEITVDGRREEVEIDAEGLPAGLADAADWPLER